MQTRNSPKVLVASAVPGRVRFSFPDFDFNGHENAIGEWVQSIKGVINFRLAKIARSLVIYYDHSRTSAEEIVDRVRSSIPCWSSPAAGLTGPALSQSGKSWKWILGALLGVLGVILFILPGVPGLPILLFGLLLLEAD